MKKIKPLCVLAVLLLTLGLFSACTPAPDGEYTESASTASDDHALTQYAPFFDFSADYGQQYLLVYAGEGESLSELRETFEQDRLTGITADLLAGFDVCDLGGDTLVLLVPRYEGLQVWINRIDHHGDVMFPGEEVARFGEKPVYIYCSFSDRLPEHEIHVSFDDFGHFFTTNEALLDSIQ